MRDFSTLPQVTIADPKGNLTVATNLIARNYLLSSLQNNINLMYKYDVKDGDTPENIAHRYYDSVDRFWIVLFANNIFDPQWQWPLTNKQFQDYVLNKYSAAANSTTPSVVLAYMQSTPHHWEQDTITFNSQDQQKQTITNQITQNTYLNSTNQNVTLQLPSGVSVTKQTNYRQVSIYDYEVAQNESNRRINIINSLYINQIESQFQDLMLKNVKH